MRVSDNLRISRQGRSGLGRSSSNAHASSSYYYQQQPPQSHSYQHAMDESTDGCSRVLQVILLGLVTAATVMSSLALSNCQFVLYFGLPNDVTNKTHWKPNFLEDGSIITVSGIPSSFGLFRYTDPDNPDYCWYYKDDTAELFPWQVRVARWTISICFCLSTIGLVLLLLKFCFCRFLCSRVLVNVSFFVAALCVPVAFVIFTEGGCQLFTRQEYSCEMGEGSEQALIAMGLLFLSLLVSCVSPKPRPIIRLVQDMEARSGQDTCCCGNACLFGISSATTGGAGSCCCPKKKKQPQSDYQWYQEHPELLLAQMPSDQVQVPIQIQGAGGATVKATLKHYWDDQSGGLTLQSQYTAAYQRWLECERNYQTMLDRFKQECALISGEINHDHLTVHGKPHDKNNEYDHESLPRSNNKISNKWRHILALPPEEIDDPELAHLRLVLDTLQRSCRQAKRVMERIEADLNELMKSPEEKMKAAIYQLELKERQQQKQQYQGEEGETRRVDNLSSIKENVPTITKTAKAHYFEGTREDTVESQEQPHSPAIIDNEMEDFLSADMGDSSWSSEKDFAYESSDQFASPVLDLQPDSQGFPSPKGPPSPKRSLWPSFNNLYNSSDNKRSKKTT